VPTPANRVAVITGAASGIGRALALELAARGACLELGDVDVTGLEGTATRCRDLGAAVRTHLVDVADHDAVTAFAEDVVSEHGAVRIVINNAGIALAAQATEQRLADVHRVLDVNLRGVINGTQAFLPALAASGDGRLVNISSVFGLVPMPFNSAYNASKFAVRGYTEAVAIELDIAGAPISVSCVHPGGIATNIAANAQSAPGNEQLLTSFETLLRMPPERAARIILRGVAGRRRRILVGADAWALHVGATVLGHRFQHVAADIARRNLPRWADRDRSTQPGGLA
jgi:NAD(P)-dependent dehydrogenase (short-subunit alcohol dehydrogenase family)